MIGSKDQLYQITIDGKKIPDILSVTVNFGSDPDANEEGDDESPENGDFGTPGMISADDPRKISPATVRVTRNASQTPLLNLFKLVTAKPEEAVIGSCTLAFTSDDVKEEYKFVLLKAYVSEWSLDNPSDSSTSSKEEFTLTVGAMKYVGSPPARDGKARTDEHAGEFNVIGWEKYKAKE